MEYVAWPLIRYLMTSPLGHANYESDGVSRSPKTFLRPGTPVAFIHPFGSRHNRRTRLSTRL
eukprot:12935020-Prorocentrum_lima.AAC.1